VSHHFKIFKFVVSCVITLTVKVHYGVVCSDMIQYATMYMTVCQAYIRSSSSRK